MRRRSIAILTLAALAGVPAAAGAQTTVPGAPGVTVLRGRVIDGTGAAPVEDGVVVIEGERIACAGAAARCRVPAGARVIDARGGTILPGLIDLHVHVWDRAMLSMFLPAGVTTVRDVHNTFENLAVLDSLTLPKPRFFRAGPLIDGRQLWQGSIVVRDSAGAAAAVDSVAARGVDVVKLYNGLSHPLLRAAAAQARLRGKRVTADLLGGQVDALQALEAGVEGFEHAGGFVTAYRRMGGDPDGPIDSALLDSLARAVVRHRAYLVPTLIVQHQYAAEERPSLTGVPLADRVPGHVHAFWARGDAVPAPMKRMFGTGERFSAALVKRVVELGGRVGAGSDLPNPYVTPGGALHQELELLVDAGLTPLQALRAATGGAADILGRGDLGVLAAGKAADVIVVAGNPAADVRATRGVRWVIRGGRVFAADSLLALAPPVREETPAAPQAPAAPAADAARLRAGTFVYEVTMGGRPAGADTLSIQVASGEVAVAQATRTPMSVSHVTARLAAPALMPVETRAVQEAQGNRFESSAAYAGGRVTATVRMPEAMGGTATLQADAPAGTADQSALLPALAALPLTQGAAWTLPVFSPYLRKVSPYRVTVGAPESVATPAGEVRAFRVAVDAGVFTQHVWISESEPRWVVATEYPAVGMRSTIRELPR